MLRPSLLRLFLLFACAALPLATAQVTETLPDPNVPGGSIIEVVTTDINGLSVSQLVGSIPPGAVTTTTNPLIPPTTVTTNPAVPTIPGLSTSTTAMTRSVTTVPVAAPVGQGPVAQPAPTVPVGQGITTYQYTTTDALGETTVIQDTFTPTYNTLSPPSSPAVGTVLGLSAWSALIGTNTVGSPTNSADRWWITRSGAGGVLALACGVVAGAFVVL